MAPLPPPSSASTDHSSVHCLITVHHFKEKEVELQPEVINPDNFPHILPPDKLIVDSNPTHPEISEVLETMKNFKNGKCLGTNLLYSEHVKPEDLLYILCIY